MLTRLVTQQTLEGRIEDGGTRCTNSRALCCSVIGAFVFILCTCLQFAGEVKNVHVHLASDQAGANARDIPCDANAARSPIQGVVHLNGCTIDASLAGVTADFQGFEDVLEIQERGQKRAWARLQVQHYTTSRRRARKTWEDTDCDGDLCTQTRHASSVRVGPYEVLGQELMNKIPGEDLKLHPAQWQQQGLSPPVQQPSGFFAKWFLNSSTMQYAEDCNCMWAGDTRIFITAAVQTVSFIGGAYPGPRIGVWEDITIHENVSVFEAGAVNAEDMLSHRLSKKDWQQWALRGSLAVILGCGLWCMIWPLIALLMWMSCAISICKATIADCCCGPCVGDMVMYREAMLQDGDDTQRGCSTCCRATLLGLLLTLLFCFTGWIGARYNIYIALGIGFIACIIESLFTCGQSTRRDQEYSSEDGGESSIAESSPTRGQR